MVRGPLIYSHMAATVAWHRSPGYDLRRTRRDLPGLTRFAAHGGIDQRFLRYAVRNHGLVVVEEELELIPIFFAALPTTREVA